MLKPFGRRTTFSLLASLALLSGCAGTPETTAAPAPDVWGKFRTPSSGPAQAIGTYNNGCLAGGWPLSDGPGYQLVRTKRHRFFAHPDMHAFLNRLGTNAMFSGGALMVSDIAQPRGGKMKTGHASHQTGLDADIWFWHPPQAAQRPLTTAERESIPPRTAVLADGKNLDPNVWQAFQTDILRAAAEDPAVERIFVNPAVKQALCRSQSEQGWLKKVRPWRGHDMHFHVRLRCPADSPLCQPQPPVSGDSGCDDSLAWWFGTEAQQPTPPAAEKPPVPTHAVNRACTNLQAEPDGES